MNNTNNWNNTNNYNNRSKAVPILSTDFGEYWKTPYIHMCEFVLTLTKLEQEHCCCLLSQNFYGSLILETNLLVIEASIVPRKCKLWTQISLFSVYINPREFLLCWVVRFIVSPTIIHLVISYFVRVVVNLICSFLVLWHMNHLM